MFKKESLKSVDPIKTSGVTQIKKVKRVSMYISAIQFYLHRIGAIVVIVSNFIKQDYI